MPTFRFSIGVSILAGILRRIALSILLLAGVALIILINYNWLAGVIVIVSAVAVQWLLRVLANRIEQKAFLDKLRYDREFAEQTAESSPELKTCAWN